jgi:histidinol-phosphate/aromatic aminotransferase/cobyric acid decarboxylase-like protein
VFPDAERYQDGPGLDWAALEAAAESAEVVVFVNPNNPTGTTIPTERLVAFARANQSRTVIVDESFLDFSDESSISGYLHQAGLANVLVITSLSKSLGVPGLRLGALLTSSPEFSARLTADLPIWNLNSVAENFLEVMLKHRPELEHSCERTRADRDDLARLLKASPLVDTVYPSGGDFLLVRLDADAAGAATRARILAEQHAILVKDSSGKLADGRGYWRLAVRTPEDHQRLAAALRSVE